jgi:hypothetical protein
MDRAHDVYRSVQFGLSHIPLTLHQIYLGLQGTQLLSKRLGLTGRPVMIIPTSAGAADAVV